MSQNHTVLMITPNYENVELQLLTEIYTSVQALKITLTLDKVTGKKLIQSIISTPEPAH